jgi:hypothetical protein
MEGMGWKIGEWTSSSRDFVLNYGFDDFIYGFSDFIYGFGVFIYGSSEFIPRLR